MIDEAAPPVHGRAGPGTGTGEEAEKGLEMTSGSRLALWLALAAPCLSCHPPGPNPDACALPYVERNGSAVLLYMAFRFGLYLDIDKLRADRCWSRRRSSSPFGISLL